MTWLKFINVFILQWLFVRLQKTVDVESGKIVKWQIIGLIVPCTGWFNNYIWVRRLR